MQDAYPKLRILVSPPPPYMKAGGENEGNLSAAAARELGGVDPRACYKGWLGYIDRLHFEFDVEVVVMPYLPYPFYDSTFVRDLFISTPKGIVMSRMRGHRVGESEHAERFLREQLGLSILRTMRNVFEGDSCYFVLPNGTAIIFGYGSRADREAGRELEELFGLPVVAVELQSWCFHQDVAGAPLIGRDPGVVYCRDALADPRHWEMIRDAVRDDRSELVQLSLEDALQYGANLRCIRHNALMSPGLSSEYLMGVHRLRYEPRIIYLGELHDRCGGFVGCASQLSAHFNGCQLPTHVRYENVRPLLISAIQQYPRKETV